MKSNLFSNLTEGGFSNSLIYECRNQKECWRFFIEHDAKMIKMDNWDPEKLVHTGSNWS